jgi:hypothetical protein
VNNTAFYLVRIIRRPKNRQGGDLFVFLALVGTDKRGKPRNMRNGKEGHKKAQSAMEGRGIKGKKMEVER